MGLLGIEPRIYTVLVFWGDLLGATPIRCEGVVLTTGPQAHKIINISRLK